MGLFLRFDTGFFFPSSGEYAFILVRVYYKSSNEECQENYSSFERFRAVAQIHYSSFGEFVKERKEKNVYPKNQGST